MSSSSSSHRCGSCGGSHRAAAPIAAPSAAPNAPTYDRCVAPVKHYNKEDCPPTFAISCETKQALRECVKTALCDFARCVTEALCPDGKFDPEEMRGKKLGQELIGCVGQLACSFLHCLPEALCPEGEEAPADTLTCDYAVEVLQ